MTVGLPISDSLDRSKKVFYSARLLRPFEGPDQSTANLLGVLVRLPVSCYALRARASLFSNVVVVALLPTHS